MLVQTINNNTYDIKTSLLTVWKKYINIDCPAIIDTYNGTMGEVDLFDR